MCDHDNGPMQRNSAWGNTVNAIATTDHRNLWLTIQDLSLIDEANVCNVLCKWLPEDFGLTAHGVRDTLRDHLRDSGCQLELMDQIGGWSSVGSIGSKYGKRYDREAISQRLIKISISSKKV